MLPLSRLAQHPMEDYLRLARDFAPVLIGAAIALRTWMKHRAAHSWPTTQGTIWSTHSRPRQRGERGKWIAELIYSYAVNGEYFSGTRALQARSEQDAHRLGSEWKGRTVSVRYAPSNPSDSVLLLDDQPGGSLYN